MLQSPLSSDNDTVCMQIEYAPSMDKVIVHCAVEMRVGMQVIVPAKTDEKQV
jgi:hypothetical protein